MSRQKITITFEVIDDDMPSERRLQYRDAVIAAMETHQKQLQTARDFVNDEIIDPDAIANGELIDKMLGDIYR